MIRPSYSASIDLDLVVDNRTLPLSQIGPDSIILSDATEFAPSRATIRMRVDGIEHCWNVYLPNGAVPFDTEVATESI